MLFMDNEFKINLTLYSTTNPTLHQTIHLAIHPTIQLSKYSSKRSSGCLELSPCFSLKACEPGFALKWGDLGMNEDLPDCLVVGNPDLLLRTSHIWCGGTPGHNNCVTSCMHEWRLHVCMSLLKDPNRTSYIRCPAVAASSPTTPNSGWDLLRFLGLLDLLWGLRSTSNRHDSIDLTIMPFHRSYKRFQRKLKFSWGLK